MATTDKKRVFVVHADRLGVLTNHQEVWAAKREGRRVDGVPHYFRKGDKIALSPEYIEKFGIAKQLKSTDRDGLPALEPVELYEKRLEVEARLAEASQAAGADAEKIEAEREELRRELQAELDRHAGATVLAEFTP